MLRLVVVVTSYKDAALQLNLSTHVVRLVCYRKLTNSIRADGITFKRRVVLSKTEEVRMAKYKQQTSHLSKEPS